jgi:hypothetical protein
MERVSLKSAASREAADNRFIEEARKIAEEKGCDGFENK